MKSLSHSSKKSKFGYRCMRSGWKKSGLVPKTGSLVSSTRYVLNNVSLLKL